jgi:hypothetical protein
MRLLTPDFTAKSTEVDKQRTTAAASINELLADPKITDFVLCYKDATGVYAYTSNTTVPSLAIYNVILNQVVSKELGL